MMPYTPRANSGAALNALWHVGAADSGFHRDGKFIMPVHRFPAAFFDPNGYVLFRTEEDYLSSPYLRIGDRVNVPGGISAMPTCRRMRD